MSNFKISRHTVHDIMTVIDRVHSSYINTIDSMQTVEHGYLVVFTCMLKKNDSIAAHQRCAFFMESESGLIKANDIILA